MMYSERSLDGAQRNPGIIRRTRLPPVRSRNSTMLNRIVVNVVNVAGEILLVAEQAFPKAPLP